MSISINCIFTQSFKDLLNALLGTGNTAVNKVTKILSLWCLYCSGGEERQYNCVYIKSNLEKKNKAGKGDRVCTCVCVCACMYTHMILDIQWRFWEGIKTKQEQEPCGIIKVKRIPAQGRTNRKRPQDWSVPAVFYAQQRCQ